MHVDGPRRCAARVVFHCVFISAELQSPVALSRRSMSSASSVRPVLGGEPCVPVRTGSVPVGGGCVKRGPRSPVPARCSWRPWPARPMGPRTGLAPARQRPALRPAPRPVVPRRAVAIAFPGMERPAAVPIRRTISTTTSNNGWTSSCKRTRAIAPRRQPRPEQAVRRAASNRAITLPWALRPEARA